MGATDSLVHIYSEIAKHITKLRKDPRYLLVQEGDGWAEFTCPAQGWSPTSGAKRTRNLTPQQRAAAGERLHRARQQMKSEAE